ncbi:hypothetical protein CspHIS471_0302930 [Cutaneotrichosporon sp. HIS471]|nr:hypothetical protein CspHIS471_0302930 [Cutaneotrichosporon sp. HIS471]
MRTTLPLFLLFGSAVADPIFYRDLHVARAEQKPPAHEAEFAAETSATAPAEAGPAAPGTEAATPASNGTAIAEVGHEALYTLADGTLAMNISVGTPPQHVLVALSFDENPSDLSLTTLDTSTPVAPTAAPEASPASPEAPVNATKRWAPSDEVVDASKEAVDTMAEDTTNEGGPGDRTTSGGQNLPDDVADVRQEATDAIQAADDTTDDKAADNETEAGDTKVDAMYAPSKEVVDASKQALDGTENLVAQEDLFNPGQSSTFQKGKETAGSDVKQGTIAADTVTVGTVSIVDQPFVIQTGSLSSAAGALSLGLRGDSVSLGGLPFYRALAAHWPAPEMGLFVASKSGATPPLENAGELTLGGLNPALYEGEMMFLPVHKNHWALKFTYLGLNFEPIMVNGTYTNATYNAAEGVTHQRRHVEEGPAAALWFGNGSLLDPELSDKLLAGIPGSSRTTTVSGTEYTVPCDTNATLTFTLAGYNFSLAPEDWIYRIPSSGGACATYFKPITDTERQTYGYGPDTLIVFGLNALRTVYTAFLFGNETEPPQIGFAKLSPAALAVVPTQFGQGSSIPGASQGPIVTGTGAGPQASAPAGTTKTSAALRPAGHVWVVLIAAALAVVVL